MQVLAAVVLLLAVASSASGSATVNINLKTDAITFAVIGGGHAGLHGLAGALDGLTASSRNPAVRSSLRF